MTTPWDAEPGPTPPSEEPPRVPGTPRRTPPAPPRYETPDVTGPLPPMAPGRCRPAARRARRPRPTRPPSYSPPELHGAGASPPAPPFAGPTVSGRLGRQPAPRPAHRLVLGWRQRPPDAAAGHPRRRLVEAPRQGLDRRRRGGRRHRAAHRRLRRWWLPEEGLRPRLRPSPARPPPRPSPATRTPPRWCRASGDEPVVAVAKALEPGRRADRDPGGPRLRRHLRQRRASSSPTQHVVGTATTVTVNLSDGSKLDGTVVGTDSSQRHRRRQGRPGRQDADRGQAGHRGPGRRLDGRRHRQPVRPQRHRHRRRRQRRRPPGRERRQGRRQHDPDRCADQPGQLGRRPGQPQRRGHRHQRRDLQPERREQRHRLRHPDRHGQAHRRQDHERRLAGPGLPRASSIQDQTTGERRRPGRRRRRPAAAPRRPASRPATSSSASTASRSTPARTSRRAIGTHQPGDTVKVDGRAGRPDRRPLEVTLGTSGKLTPDRSSTGRAQPVPVSRGPGSVLPPRNLPARPGATQPARPHPSPSGGAAARVVRRAAAGDGVAIARTRLRRSCRSSSLSSSSPSLGVLLGTALRPRPLPQRRDATCSSRPPARPRRARRGQGRRRPAQGRARRPDRGRGGHCRDRHRGRRGAGRGGRGGRGRADRRAEAPPRRRSSPASGIGSARPARCSAGYVGSILVGRDKIDAETWDELEEALIRADVGIEPTTELLDALAGPGQGATASPTAQQLLDAAQGRAEGAARRASTSTCTCADAAAVGVAVRRRQRRRQDHHHRQGRQARDR